jgi:'Cold-shock' DNA-binding domain
MLEVDSFCQAINSLLPGPRLGVPRSGAPRRELQEGQKVTFDVTQGRKGPQAENIVLA